MTTLTASLSSEQKVLLWVGIGSAVTVFDVESKTELAKLDTTTTFKKSSVALVPHQGDMWMSDSELALIDGGNFKIKHVDKLSGTGFGMASLIKVALADSREVLIEGHNSHITCIDLNGKYSILWSATLQELGRIPSIVPHAGALYIGAGGAIERTICRP